MNRTTRPRDINDGSLDTRPLVLRRVTNFDDDNDDEAEVTVYVYTAILYDGLFDGICRCAAEDLACQYGAEEWEDLNEEYCDEGERG